MLSHNLRLRPPAHPGRAHARPIATIRAVRIVWVHFCGFTRDVSAGLQGTEVLRKRRRKFSDACSGEARDSAGDKRTTSQRREKIALLFSCCDKVALLFECKGLSGQQKRCSCTERCRSSQSLRRSQKRSQFTPMPISNSRLCCSNAAQSSTSPKS